LSVNSQARAERGRVLLSEALDGLVAQPLVEIQTLEQCMATRDPAPPPRLNLSEQERRTIIHDGLDRHYRDLLDQPIPALGNKSPRAAANSPAAMKRWRPTTSVGYGWNWASTSCDDEENVHPEH
jgi:hypothetical protein